LLDPVLPNDIRILIAVDRTGRRDPNPPARFLERADDLVWHGARI